MDEPQHRCGDHHRQRGCVDRTDREHDERDPRRVSPSAAQARHHGHPHDPAESCVGEQQHRRSRDVREDVGRQLVDERSGERSQRCEPEHPGHPPHAESGREQQRADPEAVRDPVGEPQRLEEPEPRSGRPEIGDVLVGDPPGELTGIECRRGVGQEPAGVQVDVQLRVGRHPAGRSRERRHVCQQRQDRDRDRRLVPTETFDQCHVHRAGGSSPDTRFASFSTPCFELRRWCEAPASSVIARFSTNQS